VQHIVSSIVLRLDTECFCTGNIKLWRKTWALVS